MVVFQRIIIGMQTIGTRKIKTSAAMGFMNGLAIDLSHGGCCVCQLGFSPFCAQILSLLYAFDGSKSSALAKLHATTKKTARIIVFAILMRVWDRLKIRRGSRLIALHL